MIQSEPPNTPVDIAAGGAQSFCVSAHTNGRIEFSNRISVPLRRCRRCKKQWVGVNTFNLQSSVTPTPDVVAESATISNDGIVRLSNGSGAFSVASTNVGAEGFLTVRARVPDGLAVSLPLCQTDPMTAQCINPVLPAASASMFFSNEATPTFSIFPSSNLEIPFAPEVNRVFVEFLDDNGVVRGSTGVAIITQ